MSIAEDALIDAMLDYTVTSEQGSIDLLLRIQEQIKDVIADKQPVIETE